MEVRIGVQNSSREVVLESAQSGKDVANAVEKALKSGENLILDDEKGRKVIVPAAAIAYVDIAAAESRRVGFGN